MATNLKEAVLKLEVEGILSEKNLELKTENGVELIEGSLVIQTSETNFTNFRVKQYSKKKNADKSFSKDDNKTFAGLKTIYNEYKSVATDGIEQATRVRVTNGQIRPFSNYNKERGLIEGMNYSSTFFNRVKAGDENDAHANFEVEMVISSMVPEIDSEGEQTGRLKVTGWCPTYSGIEKLDLIAPVEASDEDGDTYPVADAINDAYEPGETVKFFGEAVNSRVVKETKVPVKIGKPKTSISTSYKNELVITGASEAYPEENAYDLDAVKQAVQERQNRLDKQKEDAEKGITPNKGAASKSGRKLPF